jgi:hypothetical protein
VSLSQRLGGRSIVSSLAGRDMMRVSGFVVFSLLGLAYFALALEASGLLAGVGYSLAALLWLAGLANLSKPHK